MCILRYIIHARRRLDDVWRVGIIQERGFIARHGWRSGRSVPLLHAALVVSGLFEQNVVASTKLAYNYSTLVGNLLGTAHAACMTECFFGAHLVSRYARVQP